MKTSISELNNMTEMEKIYRVNERLEEFHASNNDWQRVMEDKWRMLVWQGGNH